MVYVWNGVLSSRVQHLRLLLEYPSLLAANDRAWSANAEPCDSLHGRKLVVFDQVARNQSASSAKTCFAMDSNHAVCCLRSTHKAHQDFIAGCAAITEEKVFVCKACIHKVICLVELCVQSNHSTDVVSFKVIKVFVRCKVRVAVAHFTLLRWPTKRKKFIWY